MKDFFFKLFPSSLFLCIGGLLIVIWFRDGQIYGGGDVGLPTYDPQRIFEITKHVWWEVAAPGIPVPNSIVSAPLAVFLSVFEFFGFSTLLLQATFFFICLFLMGFGMYLVGLNVFGKENKYHATLAGLFYMFNPYMMVQVWHRFVHTTIVLAAVLPFVVLLWQKWIKQKSLMALLLFLLVNFFGVYLYGTIAYILTVWTLLSLVTIFEAVFPWKSFKDALIYITSFLIGFIFWLLTSSWWLISTFTLGPGLFTAQQHSTNESLATLLEISKQTILPYTLQLINPFYIFQQAEFGTIYTNIFFKTVPWIATLAILVGMVKSLRQEKNAKWGVLFLCLIFLTKGAATPFGYPYIVSFTKIFFLGVLRNPFEKLGILLPFASSILFVSGFLEIARWLKKHLSASLSKTILFFLLISFIGFSWPMLTGQIFGQIGKPAYVKAPDSYINTRKLIEEKYNGGNILHLPLSRNEGATYKWEYGYNGVDPNQLLFAPIPSISRGFNIMRIDDTLTGLSLIFTNPYAYDSNKILSLLQAFNVRYIILHFDMAWEGGDVYDPKEAEKILDQLPFLVEKAQIGDLKTYELLPEYQQSKILLTDQVRFVSSDKSQTRMWPWLASLNRGEILTPLNGNDIDVLTESSNEIMVFPVDEKQQTNQFKVSQAGKYELLFSNPKIREIYPDQLDNLDFQINGQTVNLKANFRDGVLASFGEIDLNEGNYTISLNPVNSINLTPPEKASKVGNVKQIDKDTFQLDSNGQDVSLIEWDLGPTSGDDFYQVTLEGNFLTGGEYDVQIIQDGDLVVNGKQKARIGTNIYFFQNGYGFKNYTIKVSPLSATTKSARIRIIVDPLGVESLNYPYFANVSTSVQVRNIKVFRVLNNKYFLRRTLKSDDLVTNSGQIIDIQKSNPILYEGKVKINKPYFMIFKESYHPGWELVLKDKDKIYKPDKRFLSNLYGNAWYIEKMGEYDFILQFKPQQKVTIGFYLSLLAISLYLVMVGFRFRKRLFK